MFFVLSKILAFLLHPLAWIVAPLGLSLIPRLARWKKALRIASLAAFLLFTNPFLTNLIERAWEYPPSDVAGNYDCAIVLGGMTIPRIQVGDQIQFNQRSERILGAIQLYKKGVIDKIIITGGSGDLRTSASGTPLLQQFAISMGVAADDIITETKSNNTHENALLVKDMVARSVEEPVLLITSAGHMRRAVGCFEKVGIAVVPYPVDYGTTPPDWHFMNFMPEGNELLVWNELIHEWIGYVIYDIVGYI